MLRFSLRNLLVNKLRLMLTVAAVTIGVTFVSGTFVLSDTMVKAFDELYTGLSSGTDVVVKSEAAYDADITETGGQLRPLDEDIVATVREVPGVEVAEGAVAGFALVLDRSGEPIQPGGAPTLGTSLTVDPRLSGAAGFREGRTPVGPREPTDDAEREVLGADSAHAAAVETADAIEEAAKVNDDPEVAEVLDDAAVKADQVTSRTGWLRRLIHLRFGREAS